MKKYIPKEIIFIVLLSIFLNILRLVLFDNKSFVWLFWNIFLAIIPFAISSLLLFYQDNNKLKNIYFLIFGFLWLIFIPNAPYLITDLIHIGVVKSVPVIYDAFLLFSMAWIGFYLCLYSIYHIDQILKKRYKKSVSEIAIFFIILFISFGIYLGRFLRFNSWDLFKDPISLLKTTHLTFLYPKDHTTYLYIVLFTIFIYIFYQSFKHIKEN